MHLNTRRNNIQFLFGTATYVYSFRSLYQQRLLKAKIEPIYGHGSHYEQNRAFIS